MIYGIINMSDRYTMSSDDPAAACAACWILGEGAYGLTGMDGSKPCPIIAFGGDADQTMKSLHGVTFNEVMKSRRQQIVEAMESVLIGGFGDREEAMSAVARMKPIDAAKWLADRHDKRRGSLNDIGGRAIAVARSMRKIWKIDKK